MPPPRWPDREAHLAKLHAAALEAAAPGAAVRRYLRVRGDLLLAGPHELLMKPGSRVHIIAFGKASVGMAAAALEVLGDHVVATIVAHPRGVEPLSGAGVQSFTCGHPIPNAASLQAGDAVVRHLRDTGEDDVILVLVSGGGSALLEALHEGIDLDQLRTLTAGLQRAGADIFELNTVRRALSRIKGGGLARLAAPSRVVALLLSDVLGDDPQTIASGPTVPSPTGIGDAVALIERYIPAEDAADVLTALTSRAEAPAPPGARSEYVVVGSNGLATAAAAAAAGAIGFAVEQIDQALVGEARSAGAAFARTVITLDKEKHPACVIAGGETTVTVTGNGRGGRNQEFALGAAGVLDGHDHIVLLSFGTDGIDGASRAAGAVVTGDTLRRAAELGLSADDALTRNDCEPFFERLDDLWLTGPTGTNVNDIALALVY